MHSSLKALALIGLISLLLAACGGAQAATQPASQPATTPSLSASEARVTIQGFAFDPAELTVKVGTTVTWTNQDGTTHTITSDDAVWDSGRVSPGGTYIRVFDKVGSFSYHCSIHTSMKGTIVVTQ